MSCRQPDFPKTWATAAAITRRHLKLLPDVPQGDKLKLLPDSDSQGDKRLTFCHDVRARLGWQCSLAVLS